MVVCATVASTDGARDGGPGGGALVEGATGAGEAVPVPTGLDSSSAAAW
jgi:hypothetical protein